MKLIKHPILCNYYLTYRCNASCNFCDIWEKPSPFVNFDNFEKNLTDLKKLGVKVIDFTGGEPLLHKDLGLFLSLAKKMGFITTVTTNCLLYPKKAKQLRGLVDMLHFSVDSSDEDKHNISRGVNCFNKVLESIEIATELGEKPDILFTVSETNIDQIENIYLEMSEPNKLILILNPLFEYNNLKNNTSFSDKSYEKLIQWGKKKNIFLNKALISLRRNGGNDITNPVCKASSTTIVISPENKLILPCYHLGIDEFDINNSLYKLYNSEQIQNLLRFEGKFPQCQGCTINCYMQPSFSVEINKYFWESLPSTIKYNYLKGTWKKLFVS